MARALGSEKLSGISDDTGLRRYDVRFRDASRPGVVLGSIRLIMFCFGAALNIQNVFIGLCSGDWIVFSYKSVPAVSIFKNTSRLFLYCWSGRIYGDGHINS